MRLEIDVQPFASRLSRALSRHSDDPGGDPAPLMVASGLGVDQERVITAICDDVHEADYGALCISRRDPAEAVRANPIPPSRTGRGAVGRNQLHHLVVRKRTAPAHHHVRLR